MAWAVAAPRDGSDLSATKVASASVQSIDAFRRGRIEGGGHPAVRPLDASPPVLHFGSGEAKKETEGAVVPRGGLPSAPLPVATAAAHVSGRQTSL